MSLPQFPTPKKRKSDLEVTTAPQEPSQPIALPKEALTCDCSSKRKVVLLIYEAQNTPDASGVCVIDREYALRVDLLPLLERCSGEFLYESGMTDQDAQAIYEKILDVVEPSHVRFERASSSRGEKKKFGLPCDKEEVVAVFWTGQFQ